MSLVAPNLSMIVGSTVAAKLIGMSLSVYIGISIVKWPWTYWIKYSNELIFGNQISKSQGAENHLGKSLLLEY